MNDSRTSKVQGKRLRREHRTFEAMLECYCPDHHRRSEASLCPECQGLLAYAALRLARCRFGAEKPTCVKCPVHCYQREYRERVRDVMRYAGPRMLWRHPVLAVRHLLDGLRPPSARIAAASTTGGQRGRRSSAQTPV